MNMALSVLNAAALVALVAFHFQDTGIKGDQLGSTAPAHHTFTQAPQLAVMTDRSVSAAMLANDADVTLQAPRAEQRWVF
ncbi:hypothetical protein KDX38_24745 [Pseudomonas sp. CDFA 602]|uniref:hypothetical protein n=1 Tax=Pseudomonas californiensis TaxID=2829823 RepID=UPI001E38F069|nr:hypothetical protein [Pseudomonas californiensis]MCD5996794.1 hypothetical protein [Pseudomonas californiensis]MCD6002392.1 hypothetical protein [Pseudomonas californiensis]